MTENNTKDSLSRCDHLRLEAYRTHNQWNDHDGKNMMLMDAILGAIAAALLFRDLSTILNTCLLKLVASLVLLAMIGVWSYFYVRFSQRMEFRYNTMRDIEGKLGFRAHKEIETFISKNWLQQMKLRDVRILLTVLLLGVVIVLLWLNKQC